MIKLGVMQKLKDIFKGIESLFVFTIEQRLLYQREVNNIRAVAGDSLKNKTDVEIVEMALRQYAQVHAYGIDSDDKLHQIMRNSVIFEKKPRETNK